MFRILKKIVKWSLYFMGGIFILGIVVTVIFTHMKTKDYEKRNEACGKLKAGQAFNVFDFTEKYSEEATVSVEPTGEQKELYYEKKRRKILAEDFFKYNKMTGKVVLITGAMPSWHFFCDIDLIAGEITKVKMSGVE